MDETLVGMRTAWDPALFNRLIGPKAVLEICVERAIIAQRDLATALEAACPKPPAPSAAFRALSAKDVT